MMENKITVRMANESDAEELLNIYAPYVQETAITFEYVVPTVSEFRQRIGETLKKYPYLVAVQNDTILGYAYASAFKNRAAYDWSVETTVYVKRELKRSGVGKKLYLALEEILKAQQITNLYACIAYPNPDSIAFHERLGYKTIGHFSKCGYKLETWYDMVWMEKMLGEHDQNPKPLIPIGALPQPDILLDR